MPGGGLVSGGGGDGGGFAWGAISGYTIGMKTAISLPDDVFDSAERLAKRLRVSRSELYSRALSEFLARHSPDEVTESWNSVVSDVGQAEDTGTGAARAIFEQVEW